MIEVKVWGEGETWRAVREADQCPQARALKGSAKAKKLARGA